MLRIAHIVYCWADWRSSIIFPPFARSVSSSLVIALRDILHRHSSSCTATHLRSPTGQSGNRQADVYRAAQEALVDAGCCAGMFKCVQGGGPRCGERRLPWWPVCVKIESALSDTGQPINAWTHRQCGVPIAKGWGAVEKLEMAGSSSAAPRTNRN